MSNNRVPFTISRRKLDQENEALRKQVRYLLAQNNNLGRINVSALNCIERVENIVKGLQISPVMPWVALIWRRLFLDLSVIIGQTSRFTIRDAKGNFMVKAEKAPDSALVEKVEQQENQDVETQESHGQNDEPARDAVSDGGGDGNGENERQDAPGHAGHRLPGLKPRSLQKE